MRDFVIKTYGKEYNTNAKAHLEEPYIIFIVLLGASLLRNFPGKTPCIH